MLLVVVAAALTAAAASAEPPTGRLMPPDAVTCPRDHLTSYTGQVVRYGRSKGRTDVRIRTDWDTTEEVSISHPGSDDPSRWFLVHGRRFQPADWSLIEERAGRLHAGMRAAAWVCDDDRNPIVDWDAPREP
jgi:hypothetical protein